MNNLKKTVTALGLLTTAGVIGFTSLKISGPANAEILNDAVATYSAPKAYNPYPQYYVPGELTYTHSRINVRTGPGTHYHARHYGLKGDRVTVLNDEFGKDGYRWYYLKFNQSGAKGWFREDLVLLND